MVTKKKKKRVLSVANFRFQNKPRLLSDISHFSKPQSNLQQLKLEKSKQRLLEFYSDAIEKHPKKKSRRSGMRGIKTSTEVAQLYIEQVVAKLLADEGEFLEALAKPVYKNPISVLKEIKD